MRLHVETTGAPGGDPVLFLHGVTGSGATYRWLEPDSYRAVRLDFRGHGKSERAPGTYRIADYVADAVSVLEGLDRPAVLVGHSLGGVTAWSTAQRRPDLVKAAFLEDPPLYMGEPQEHANNRAIAVSREAREVIERWQAEGLDIATGAARLAAQPFPPDLTVGDIHTDDALAARAYGMLRLDVEVLDRVIDGSCLAGTDTSSPVTVPVFVLAAEEASSAFPHAHEARLAATHPDVEVVRLDGAGHSIHDERAHRASYVRHLAAFVTRRLGAAPAA